MVDSFSVLLHLTVEDHKVFLDSVDAVIPVVLFMQVLGAALVLNPSGSLGLSGGCNPILDRVDMICLKALDHMCVFRAERRNSVYYIGLDKGGRLTSVRGDPALNVEDSTKAFRDLGIEILFAWKEVAGCKKNDRWHKALPECEMTLIGAVNKAAISIASEATRWRLRRSQFRARSALAHGQFKKLRRTCRRRIGTFKSSLVPDDMGSRFVLGRQGLEPLKSILAEECPRFHPFDEQICGQFSASNQKRGIRVFYPLY